MYPGEHAIKQPDRIAVVLSRSGAARTYGELNDNSNRIAQYFHQVGLRPGDQIAFCVENNLVFFDLVWAALRSGLYFTPISTRLTPAEVEYIVDDCGASVFITSEAREDLAEALTTGMTGVGHRLYIGAQPPTGWGDFEATMAMFPAEPIAEELEGIDMLYSSGTTGQPKGVRRALPNAPAGTADNAVWMLRDLMGCTSDMVFLSTAPLYHGAPLILGTAVHRIGGTLVVMEKFDPAEALEAIELYQVTDSQWVPTMFVRLLKVEPEVRTRFDLSSHRLAIHGAGPCPVEVKRAMIDWWGPILFDYYSGTEGAGVCAITSEEWLAHPGSVGRPVIGEVHVIDDDGNECPVGEAGLVYFAGGPKFEYHNDPDKTAQSRNANGWATLGDVGYRDAEGYLYLTDRKAFTINSGGVNIYPQEIEDVLIMHPKVRDVAVFGVPHADLVEETKAVVETAPGIEPSDDLAAELIAFTRTKLASYKLPRSVDFIDEMPRAATGKLYKKALRATYWP